MSGGEILLKDNSLTPPQESLGQAMRSAGVGNRCVVDSVASSAAASQLAPAFAAQVCINHTTCAIMS